jgi:hypothetical protein
MTNLKAPLGWWSCWYLKNAPSLSEQAQPEVLERDPQNSSESKIWAFYMLANGKGQDKGTL